jgi:hypothetical protein
MVHAPQCVAPRVFLVRRAGVRLRQKGALRREQCKLKGRMGRVYRANASHGALASGFERMAQFLHYYPCPYS